MKKSAEVMDLADIKQIKRGGRGTGVRSLFSFIGLAH